MGDVVAGETAIFTDDAPVRINNIRDENLDSSLAVPQSDINSIRTFMAKPIRIHSGTITASETFGELLISGSILSLLKSKRLWLDKIRGYKFVRGTCVLCVVLNAQPFQQGRLCLSFLPQYTQKVAFSPKEGVRLRGMCQRTQSPNVEIDFRDGSGELRIPYIAPSLWCDWIRDHSTTATLGESYDWGDYFLSVLSPI